MVIENILKIGAGQYRLLVVISGSIAFVDKFGINTKRR
jgi:hypothetical protein